MNTSKQFLAIGLLSLAGAVMPLAHAASNLFNNGDFESGDVGTWITEGSPSVVSTEGASGLYAVKLGGTDAISAQWLAGRSIPSGWGIAMVRTRPSSSMACLTVMIGCTTTWSPN